MMNREATTACFQFIFGLFVGLVSFFCHDVVWVTESPLWSMANFISNVLFRALVIAVILGGILSVIIYPVQRFCVRRNNKYTVSIYVTLGLAAGYFLFKIVPVKVAL